MRVGISRPAVFGTRVAVDGRYFAEPFDAAGIELVRPRETDRQWVHDAYLQELVIGVFHDATRDRMLAILAKRDPQLASTLPRPAIDRAPMEARSRRCATVGPVTCEWRREARRVGLLGREPGCQQVTDAHEPACRT